MPGGRRESCERHKIIMDEGLATNNEMFHRSRRYSTRLIVKITSILSIGGKLSITTTSEEGHSPKRPKHLDQVVAHTRPSSRIDNKLNDQMISLTAHILQKRTQHGSSTARLFSLFPGTQKS